MTRLYHQNNFATNLTSNQIAGVTTTPLNDIPTVTAPFRIALDATNTNGKFEVVTVTSKTATHILHAATVYEHTTAETVSLIVDAAEMDEISAALSGAAPLAIQAPQGFLINGKISVTDAAGITVAIKTLAGTDPSTTDPVYVRIGDTVRTISAALSVAKADGTNWMNAGSAELATKEIDYFVYLGYNATDGVVIGFSRIPSAAQYSDFSVTTTNEKYCAISTITNAAATDYYEVVGRFAATLSAGAGYTWSVPTYTAINLIQRPIYETRHFDCSGNITGWTSFSTRTIRAKLIGNRMFLVWELAGTSNSTSTSFITPFASSNVTNPDGIQSFFQDNGVNNSATPGRAAFTGSSSTINLYKNLDAGGWTSSGTKISRGQISYEI